jgi:uncharacterized protein YqgC (DUF456 family)
MEPAFIITIGVILLLIGLVSCVLPPLPGPPIAFLALLLAYFGLDKHDALPPWLLITLGFLAVLISIVDSFIPVWSTKKFGGTKAGIRGSFIGILVGIFFLPLGGWSILLCPFLGAIIGELISGQPVNVAFKSGIASFIGFLLTSGIKIILVVIMCIFYFKAVL